MHVYIHVHTHVHVYKFGRLEKGPTSPKLTSSASLVWASNDSGVWYLLPSPLLVPGPLPTAGAWGIGCVFLHGPQLRFQSCNLGRRA